MRFIHLKDEAHYYNAEKEGVQLLVSLYTDEDWQGDGHGLLLRNDRVEYHDLSHCSCFGPFETDSWIDKKPELMTVAEFKEQNSGVIKSWPDELGDRFLEELTLLGY